MKNSASPGGGETSKKSSPVLFRGLKPQEPQPESSSDDDKRSDDWNKSSKKQREKPLSIGRGNANSDLAGYVTVK